MRLGYLDRTSNELFVINTPLNLIHILPFLANTRTLRICLRRSIPIDNCQLAHMSILGGILLARQRRRRPMTGHLLFHHRSGDRSCGGSSTLLNGFFGNGGVDLLERGLVDGELDGRTGGHRTEVIHPGFQAFLPAVLNKKKNKLRVWGPGV